MSCFSDESNVQKRKEQHLFEIEIFRNIINDFTVTLDQLMYLVCIRINVLISFQNKQTKILPNPNFEHGVDIM